MDDADERAGSPDLADLGVRGRTAGPTHPLAAWRFQRAARSGGASESQNGKFSVSVHALGDERGSQRDGARRGRSCDSDPLVPDSRRLGCAAWRKRPDIRICSTGS